MTELLMGLSEDALMFLALLSMVAVIGSTFIVCYFVKEHLEGRRQHSNRDKKLPLPVEMREMDADTLATLYNVHQLAAVVGSYRDYSTRPTVLEEALQIRKATDALDTH